MHGLRNDWLRNTQILDKPSGKSYRVEWRIYSWHRVRTKERVMQPKVILVYQIFWNGGVAQLDRATAFEFKK